MSEIIQWIITTAVLVWAVRFLYLRFRKKSGGCACDGNCSGCSLYMKELDKCGDNKRQG